MAKRTAKKAVKKKPVESPGDKDKKRASNPPRDPVELASWSAETLRAETGKLAIKVINHYGDEVMKVYEIEK